MAGGISHVLCGIPRCSAASVRPLGSASGSTISIRHQLSVPDPADERPRRCQSLMKRFRNLHKSIGFFGAWNVSLAGVSVLKMELDDPGLLDRPLRWTVEIFAEGAQPGVNLRDPGLREDANLFELFSETVGDDNDDATSAYNFAAFGNMFLSRQYEQDTLNTGDAKGSPTKPEDATTKTLRRESQQVPPPAAHVNTDSCAFQPKTLLDVGQNLGG